MNELSNAVEQFMQTRGLSTQNQTSDVGLSKSEMNVLICIPTHDGKIEFKCVLSLLTLAEELRSAGIRYEVQVIAGSSQINAVRNFFGNKVAFDCHPNGLPYSSLLFVDSDCSFQAEDILKLIRADKPIAALPYAFKQPNWKRVARAVRSGVSDEYLGEFVGEPVVRTDSNGSPFAVDKLCPVRSVGIGLALIKSEVFRALAASHPEWRSKVHPIFFYGNPIPAREFQYQFFQFDVGPDGYGRSEDYFFMDHAREAGFETWILPGARTVHSGNFDFVLNLPAVASLGVQGDKPK